MQPTRFRGTQAPEFGGGADPCAIPFGQGSGPRATTNAAATNHRIPMLVKAANGDYLLFVDSRSNGQDYEGFNVLMYRSVDKGKTWAAPVTVYNHAAFAAGTNWIGLGSVVVDDVTNIGNIFLFIFRADGTAGAASAHETHVFKSTNHGASWDGGTNITSTVKVAGGGATPAGHGFPATNWTHCVPACTAGITIKRGANRGRMIIPCDHRTVDFSSATTCWSHVFKSDDGGDSWSLYTEGGGAIGGLDQTVGGNAGSNECAIVETDTTDRLVMHIRNVNSATTRYQSVSTDCGATWSTMASLTALECGVSSGTSSDVKQCNGLTVACYSGDKSHAARATLFLAYSTDQGANWPAANARILAAGSYAGYSSMICDGDDITIAYEGGSGNVAATPVSAIANWVHSIRIIKLNRQYLLKPTLRYSQWFLNEEASGTVVQTAGCGLLDYGNLDVRGYAKSAAAPPSYGSDGIPLASGTADALVFAGADDTVFDLYTDNSLTVEVEATLTAATVGVLACKWTGTFGWQLEITAGGKLKATIGDGTFAPAVTGGTTINGGGERKVYAFTRNVVTDKIQVYIDGVADATEVTDTTTGSCAAVSVPVVVGDNNGGTLPIGATIHSVKITRGIAPIMLVAPVSKKTPQQLRNYSTPSLGFPTLAAGASALKLWLGQTIHGRDAFADLYCSERYREPYQSGDAIRSFLDGSTRRARYYNSEASRILRAVDANMGPCFDMDAISASGSGFLKNLSAYGATDGHDYIQNTGVFTICFAINFKATTSASQVIVQNNDAANSNGFYLYRPDGASSKLTLFVYGGGALFNQNIAAGPALPYGSSYFVAIVGQGGSGSDKVRVYSAPLNQTYNPANPYTPTLSTGESTNNFSSVAAQPFVTPSGNYMTVGQRQTASNAGNFYFKNLMLFNATLSQADIQLLANFCVAG